LVIRLGSRHLSWNGHGDLLIVVVCTDNASSKQLFRNPVSFRRDNATAMRLQDRSRESPAREGGA
jgi:hypothetical protein